MPTYYTTYLTGAKALIKNARIHSTKLGYDHGYFILSIDFALSSTTFQGVSLKLSPNTDAINKVSELIKAVGVESWESLPNSYVRLHYDTESTLIQGLSNILSNGSATYTFPT